MWFSRRKHSCDHLRQTQYWPAAVEEPCYHFVAVWILYLLLLTLLSPLCTHCWKWTNSVYSYSVSSYCLYSVHTVKVIKSYVYSSLKLLSLLRTQWGKLDESFWRPMFVGIYCMLYRGWILYQLDETRNWLEDPCLLAFTVCCTKNEYYISWMRLWVGVMHWLCVCVRVCVWERERQRQFYRTCIIFETFHVKQSVLHTHTHTHTHTRWR